MEHNYMVVCRNQKFAYTLFKRLYDYLYSKNIKFKANRISYSINISDLGDIWIVRFISEELYYHIHFDRGFRGNVMWGYHVERTLDDLEKEDTNNE